MSEKPYSFDPNRVFGHIAYQVLNARRRDWPYPHLVVENWLPWDLYAELEAAWPSEAMVPIEQERPVKGYPQRKVFPKAKPSPWIWSSFKYLCGYIRFQDLISNVFFDPSVSQKCHNDTLLIEDSEGYSIGPHTDSPAKAISLLAYFPHYLDCAAFDGDDPDYTEYGTSLYYSPSGFTCPGGPHYDLDDPSKDLTRVYQVPFEPNTMVVFAKSDWSFHGVEPFKGTAPRRVFLWNLRWSPNNG